MRNYHDPPCTFKQTIVLLLIRALLRIELLYSLLFIKVQCGDHKYCFQMFSVDSEFYLKNIARYCMHIIRKQSDCQLKNCYDLDSNQGCHGHNVKY